MDSSSTALFAMALGLTPPWTVDKIEFTAEGQQLDLWLDFAPGATFACPECECSCKVHDTSDRTWRHLDFFQHRTLLHARQPRITCPEHGGKTVSIFKSPFIEISLPDSRLEINSRTGPLPLAT